MLDINDKILCSSCFSEQVTNSDICDVCGFDNSSVVENTGTLPMNTILLGKYIVGKVLGRGGFGITYLSYDIPNDKKVAIKEYFPDFLSYRLPGTEKISSYSGDKKTFYEDGSEKFYNEAKVLSRFNGNENIINVSEFFYENNTAYYVMEYVDGVDLKKYIAQKGGKLSFKETMDIMNPVLYALIIVHSMDVLHRDISPDNIYITKSGNVKLLDFGAARQLVSEKSNSLSVVLKQGFTPIEQYRKRGNHGPWSDIYSFGATIYYALTGIVPEESINRVEMDDLKPPSQLGIAIPKSFEKILMKTLAVKPEDRYQSVTELKEAIQNSNNTANTPHEKKPSSTRKFFDEFNKGYLRYKILEFKLALFVALGLFLFGVSWYAVKSVINQFDSNVTDKPYSLEFENTTIETSYSGEWKNKNPNGEGEMIIEKSSSSKLVDGDILSGNFVDGLLQGKGILQREGTFTYTGDFKDSIFHGEGVVVGNDNETYSGSLSMGYFDGSGIATYSNGDMYEGDFKMGVRSGMGQYTYSSGDVYEGEFKNNLANGNGKYYFIDGDTYEGEFLDGKENGNGTYTFATGEKYVGEYSNGTWHGYGVYTDANGNIINTGMWQNGVYVGE